MFQILVRDNLVKIWLNKMVNAPEVIMTTKGGPNQSETPRFIPTNVETTLGENLDLLPQ